MYTGLVNIYWLDLVGVFAFAFLGARLAIEQRCNALGVFVYGFLAALGGGTVREIMLNHLPFYFRNNTYLLVVAMAALFSALLYQRFRAVRSVVVIMDAVGAVAFAYIGAHAASLAHFGLAGTAFFAVLTACGGGVLCEVVACKAPRAFHDGFYTVPPIMLGCTYWLLGDAVYNPTTSVALLASSFVAQLTVAHAGLITRKLRAKRHASQARTALLILCGTADI